MIEEKIKTKEVVNKSLLPDYIETILLVNKKIGTYEELKKVIEEDFDCLCPIDWVIDYFKIQIEIEDLKLIHAHYGNDY